jgi:hypothetical protein
MARRPPEKAAFVVGIDIRSVERSSFLVARLKDIGGVPMKTAAPVKKTGKLTSKKLEKKAPLMKLC